MEVCLPTSFHGVRPCHAMPCQRSCCRAPSPTAVGPSPPAIVTLHQAHELRGGSKTQYGDARRGCKLGTAARARRRPGVPRNGRTEDPKGGRYMKYRPHLGSSRSSDPGWAAKIRRVATGVFLRQAPICSVGRRKAADHGASETTRVPMQPHALVPPESTG